LRRGQPFRAVLAHDDHFLDGEDAAAWNGQARLDSKDYAFLKVLERFLSVLFPRGAQEGGSVKKKRENFNIIREKRIMGKGSVLSINSFF
jgi:hypothetical protein